MKQEENFFQAEYVSCQVDFSEFHLLQPNTGYKWVERDEEVDLFIYVTATGTLTDSISNSTVNFKKTKGIFEDYKNVLSMPIWLIGIDIR